MISRRIPMVVVLLALSAAARATAQPGPGTTPDLIGQPSAIVVQPSAVELVGPRARQQLVVTGKYADGSTRDLTQACLISSASPAVATVAPNGLVVPHKNGTTTVIVRAGGQSVQLIITVRDVD